MSELIKLLADLGDTPEAVAATLRAAGVQGRREHCWLCPVARYLGEKLNRPNNVDVDLCDVTVYDLVGGVQYKMESVELPKPVEKFVSNFDGGDYPDLDADRDDSAGLGVP